MQTAVTKPAAQPIESKQIRKIHVLKNKLGWSDPTYRSFLSSYYNVHSSKELHLFQRESLISRMVNELRQSKTDSHSVSDKQIKLIMFLGTKYCGNIPAFCKKITGRDSTPQTLTKLEGIKVIDALKRYERPFY